MEGVIFHVKVKQFCFHSRNHLWCEKSTCKEGKRYPERSEGKPLVLLRMKDGQKGMECKEAENFEISCLFINKSINV